MRIVISIFAVLFGLLHIIAAAAQFKSKDPAVRGSAALMACGGVLLLSSAIAHLAYGGSGGWMVALSAAVCGFLPICFAAYLNGKRSGNFHPSHHIVRGIAALLLVAGIAVL